MTIDEESKSRKKSHKILNQYMPMEAMDDIEHTRSRMKHVESFWEDFEKIEQFMQTCSDDMTKHFEFYKMANLEKEPREMIEPAVVYTSYVKNGFSSEKIPNQRHITSITTVLNIDIAEKINNIQSKGLIDCIKLTFKKKLEERIDRNILLDDIVILLQSKEQSNSLKRKPDDLPLPYQLHIIIYVQEGYDVDQIHSSCEGIFNSRCGTTGLSDFLINLKLEINANKIQNLAINKLSLQHAPKITSETNAEICGQFGKKLCELITYQGLLSTDLQRKSKNEFEPLLSKLKDERKNTLQPDAVTNQNFQKKYFKVKIDSEEAMLDEYSEEKYLDIMTFQDMKRYGYEIKLKNLYDRRTLYQMEHLTNCIEIYWSFFRKGYVTLKKFMEQQMPIMKAHIELKIAEIKKRDKQRRTYMTDYLRPKIQSQKKRYSIYKRSKKTSGGNPGIRDNLDNAGAHVQTEGDDETIEYALYSPPPAWGRVKVKIDDFHNLTVSYLDSDREDKKFNLQLCTIKPKEQLLKYRFVFAIMDHTREEVILQAENSERMEHWMQVIGNRIQNALGKQQEPPENIKALLKIAGNNICADCEHTETDWCLINLGVTLCVKCAGIHRKRGKNKVRSLIMDSLKPEVIEILQVIGNKKANDFLLSSQNDIDKLTYGSKGEARENFITQKYESLSFTEESDLSQEEKNESLFVACKKTECIDIFCALARGAEVNSVDQVNDGKTPIHVAVETGDPICVELLLQNGANSNIPDVNGVLPLEYAEKSNNDVIIQKLKKRKKNIVTTTTATTTTATTTTTTTTTITVTATTAATFSTSANST